MRRFFASMENKPSETGPEPNESEKPENARPDAPEDGAAAASAGEEDRPNAQSHEALFADYDASEPMREAAGEQQQPQAIDRLKSIIEALLFVSASPLTLTKLSEAIPDYPRKEITKAVAELRTEYMRQGRGFVIEEIAGGYQMLSNPEHVEYVRALHARETSSKLTPAMLETLAIVAYKQPILRADIEAIRGVQVGPIVRSLMERGLVKVAGRADEAGKPFLYGTTKKFLEHFGLRSIEDLPNVEELKPPEER